MNGGTLRSNISNQKLTALGGFRTGRYRCDDGACYSQNHQYLEVEKLEERALKNGKERIGCFVEGRAGF